MQYFMVKDLTSGMYFNGLANDLTSEVYRVGLFSAHNTQSFIKTGTINRRLHRLVPIYSHNQKLINMKNRLKP